jgi:hypothetical protein
MLFVSLLDKDNHNRIAAHEHLPRFTKQGANELEFKREIFVVQTLNKTFIQLCLTRS